MKLFLQYVLNLKKLLNGYTNTKEVKKGYVQQFGYDGLSNKIVNYVIDNGITCFDTAQAYGDSEIVLGQTIESKENIFLISKLKSEKFQNNSIENVLYSHQNLGKKSLDEVTNKLHALGLDFAKEED